MNLPMQDVRVIVRDNEPYFNGRDLARLGENLVPQLKGKERDAALFIKTAFSDLVVKWEQSR